ncbi:MAG TPA: hypothetical protein VEX43_19510 [Chthoniobacterales bacterium]|nr:hypothetical protein [Chthoniobacterales bacterium]
MKRLFAVFVLTPAEQRLIIFVVLLLVAGAWLKQQRDLKYNGPAPSVTSPSPADQ